MTDIRPQPGILDIALYQGGKAHVAGVQNAVKLSSNENPFGPSDKSKDAFARTVHSLHRYPGTDHADLREPPQTRSEFTVRHSGRPWWIECESEGRVGHGKPPERGGQPHLPVADEGLPSLSTRQGADLSERRGVQPRRARCRAMNR